MDIVSLIMNILQITAVGFIIFTVIRRLHIRKSSIILGFFLYAVICTMLSDLYWIALEVLKPGVRLPYGVNEIAEMGESLLFAALLSTVFGLRRVRAGMEVLLTVLFSLGSMALWIAWNGEWIKDIVGAIPYCYLMCVTVMSLKKTAALTKREAVLAGSTAFLIIAVFGIQLFLLETLAGMILDTAGSLLAFSGVIWISLKSIRSLSSLQQKYRSNDGFAHDGYVSCIEGKNAGKKEDAAGREVNTDSRKGSNSGREQREKAMALTFAALLWIQNTMYMSAEPLYFVADLLYTLALIAAMYSCIAVADEV
ncbi:MAG: hypothetical protein K6G81_11640 [Lachnospiraceae bacterium]|nr:hypothetical protein [Lachnospiraceae bacterium]